MSVVVLVILSVLGTTVEAHPSSFRREPENVGRIAVLTRRLGTHGLSSLSQDAPHFAVERIVVAPSIIQIDHSADSPQYSSF